VSSEFRDGKWHHTYRQSWIKNLMMCPELARLKMNPDFREAPSDSTAMGTSLHTAIQCVLDAKIQDGVALPEHDMLDIFEMELTDLWTPDLRERKRSFKGSLMFGRAAARAFYAEVLPTLKPVATEVDFGPLLLHSDSDRSIYLKGQMDYLDEDGLKDWKTASAPYERWEKDRWDVQATTYTWAAAQRGLVEYMGQPLPFEFVIHLARGKVQRLSIERDYRHWEWMTRQLVSVSRLIEAELTEWPLNDHGWWCSEKWCPVWAGCKGAHIDLPTRRDSE
jgi:hypothetical protein